ncbi:MAG TPA: phytanoyl-CoA dioxygenase family protein [Myxococcota bacterium]|jgi:ectoine hydroxylase-related dioxygenase (phytanoyl-CoA dioxygenase family)
MTYPRASAADVETFQRDGYLVVRDAVEPRDLDRLQAICDRLLEQRDQIAFDWAWEAGTDREHRAFKIVQTSPSLLSRAELERERFRVWATEFASDLLGRGVEFWYDQFLAKPPREGARTPWHQDEGYWGRNLEERGITCWMPFHDVSVENGCMHFVPGAHREGVISHQPVPGVQSDLLFCEVDEARALPIPMKLGDVSFHHGKMPHMTTPNASNGWRRALSQHFRVIGSKGEGDHYPWKIYVNQFTGERVKPSVR